MAARLLLVDDNKQSLKLLSAILSIEGYDIETAPDGNEAINILLSRHIDLVVTDILMPNVDGYYLCFKIRENPTLNKMPVIIYTATYTSRSEESIALELGADLFLRKPAPAKQIIESVAKLLESPRAPRHAITRTEKSFEAMHRYSSDLITKLEHRNIELEQTTANLESTLEQFKEAERIAGMGHWQMDLDSQAFIMSDSLYSVYGYDPGSVNLNPEFIFSIVHPDDRNHVKETTEEVMVHRKPASFTYRIISPSGDVRYLFSLARLVYDSSNHPTHMSGIVIDTTTINEKEHQLLASNKELETFIYKSSHDLRGPIASILGLVNLTDHENDETVLRSYISHIKELTLKQAKMLDDLTATMAIKEAIPAHEVFDLLSLIKESIQDISTHGQDRPPRIEVNAKLHMPIVSDRKILKGILHQILLNAIHFSDSNKNENRITIDTRVVQNNVEVMVKDNGIGIPDEVKPHIFDLFYRGSELSRGSGLGLYLVRNAIKKIGGIISVESKVGLGTTITMKIPVGELHILS